jgi:hypothetical protein
MAHGWGSHEDVPLSVSSYSDEQLSNINFLHRRCWRWYVKGTAFQAPIVIQFPSLRTTSPWVSHWAAGCSPLFVQTPEDCGQVSPDCSRYSPHCYMLREFSFFAPSGPVGGWPDHHSRDKDRDYCNLHVYVYRRVMPDYCHKRWGQ